MTTPARVAEADRVELVYYWALNQMANRTIVEVRVLWDEEPPSGAARSYLTAMLGLVTRRRTLATRLALAYYRLVRALRTGATVQDPSRPDELGTVRLDDLRDQFEQVVDAIDAEVVGGLDETQLPVSAQPVDPETGEIVEVDEDPPELDPVDDDDSILLEELRELEEELRRLDEEAEAEAQRILDALGPTLLEKKLEAIDDEQAARDADAARREAAEQAARRSAAAAARISMNAARGLPYSLGEYDGRVLGWARYSQTGTPCGWCAMLLSRGAVYKTRASAGDRADVDKYHDNCRCVAVPVFLEDQYESSDLFALNRRYAEEWPRVTRGFAGKAALSVWRRQFRPPPTA
jgi:hypothetical protein